MKRTKDLLYTKNKNPAATILRQKFTEQYPKLYHISYIDMESLEPKL